MGVHQPSLVLAIFAAAATGCAAPGSAPDAVDASDWAIASTLGDPSWSLHFDASTTDDRPRLLDAAAAGLIASSGPHGTLAPGASFSLEAALRTDADEAAAAPDGPDREAAGGDDLGEISKKLNNPVGPLWLLFNQHDTTWNDGDLRRGSTPQHVYKANPVLPLPITDDWNLIVRPVISLVNVKVPDRDDGEFERHSGFGDSVLLTVLSPNEGGEMVWGAGTTTLFPTASNDKYGQEQFAIGPAGTAFYLGEKWVLGTVVQQFWGFSESSGRETVNLLDFQYVVRYRITPTFQLGCTPNIQVDWEADSGDKWTVPVGLGADWTTRIGDVPVRIGIEYQRYLHQRDDFGPEWGIRLFFIPVIPNPLQD